MIRKNIKISGKFCKLLEDWQKVKSWSKSGSVIWIAFKPVRQCSSWKSKCQPAEGGGILKSSDSRSIEWQLYSRSLMKWSAKKVYLTLEILSGAGKWFYDHIYFAILSGVCFKKYIERLEEEQRSCSYEKPVKMLSGSQYLNVFETKPEVCCLECSSVFEKTKCQNREVT